MTAITKEGHKRVIQATYGKYFFTKTLIFKIIPDVKIRYMIDSCIDFNCDGLILKILMNEAEIQQQFAILDFMLPLTDNKKNFLDCYWSINAKSHDISIGNDLDKIVQKKDDAGSFEASDEEQPGLENKI